MTPTPKRVRINWRVKGGKKPDNVVSVIRGTQWGNPFKVGGPGIPDNAAAVHRFRQMLSGYPRSYPALSEIYAHLQGCDLACWCKLCDRHKDGLPLGETCPDCDPCHADVLLALANEWER